MNRRLLIAAGIVAAAGVLAVWLIGGRPGRPGHADGPIVIVSIDTLRADRLPAYGYTRSRTPNIDRLARDGVLFENAYAHAPQTLPSHTSILSGQLPFEHGVRDNVGFSVKSGQRFLQHSLKEAGFATAAFVSSYVLRRQTGFDQGFDRFDDELPAVSPDVPLASVSRRGEETVSRAIGWIDAQPSPRFFLFVHIYEPHTPYDPPPRFANENSYDGEVEYSDEIVGRLIEHLKQKQLYDTATVIVLSDHGEGLGDHGEEEHGIFLYRETIRVPLILKLAGSQSAGRRVTTPVQHVDLVPTLLDLAGVSTAKGPGRSLVPVLTGSGTLQPASIYSESLSPRYHFGWSELYALSDERYRFIRAPRDELYDLQRDPLERASIAGERAPVRTAMRGALDQLIGGRGISAPSAASAEDRQRLAALGYIGTQSSTSLQLPGDQLPDPKDKVTVLKQYRDASVLASAGKYEQAAQTYRALLVGDPGMTDVWLKLADVEIRRGDNEEALAAYKQVISRNPKDPGALTGAAAVLVKLGRIDEAAAHAELAVAVAPASAHEVLARIAANRRDAATARRQAQLAQQADPSLAMIPFTEGLLAHGEGRWQDAAQRFLEARDAMRGRTEQLVDLNYYAADSLARLERYSEAEQLFNRELEITPGHVRARAGLAMLYRASGRIPESDRAVAELVRQTPTREGLEVAAQLWTMFGEPARAAAARAEMRRLPR